MAFCLNRILLFVLALNLQALQGMPVKRLRRKQANFVNKARDIVISTKSSEANDFKHPRQVQSSFKFLSQSDIDKGLDHLKKKYPNVDWSLLTPLPSPSSGKREFEDMNSVRQVKRTSSFMFFNQSDIDKGLDHLKKKYPNVDWSIVTPLPSPSSGKREFEDMNSVRQVKRTSSFMFLNQSDIDKGLDHLKKKYPNVDWSIVTPLPSPSSGKREFEDKTFLRQPKRTSSFIFLNQSDIDKGLDHLKKKYPNVDWSIVTPLPSPNSGKREIDDKNSIGEPKRTSSFMFLNQSDIDKGLDHLKKKYPNVDWSIVTPLHSPSSGKREFEDKTFLRQPKRTSSFIFLNQSDIDKGLDHLKKKYPNVDWSIVTALPSPSSGKREFEDMNFVRQVKRTSSFMFLNQSNIDKGLDHLKKKYPNVDWSIVTPLPSPNSGKREIDDKNSIGQPKRTSSFIFLNQSDIDKGLDHLKKKYPDVDWSLVTPLSSPNSGKREFTDPITGSVRTDTKSYVSKRLYQEKKNLDIFDTSIQERNKIPEKQHEKDKHRFFSSFFFPEPQDMKGQKYSQEKYPNVDWFAFSGKTLDT